MPNKIVRKPEWLRKKITPSANKEMEELLSRVSLKTICQEAACPNVSECFSKKQATFLILGSVCTRACSFCAVGKGKPSPLNPDEPRNVARGVVELGLRHVVITSPTRDDLIDGGAERFCATVSAIHFKDPSIVVELLIPDMGENEEALKRVANCGARIIGHNLETVPRLYHVRKDSDYERSLRVLKTLSSLNPSLALKSGLMLGFGESDEEVEKLMKDLLGVGCRYLSIGQYLSPSVHHERVVEYATPQRFERLREMGMKMGFAYIKSSPYARSSYMASEYLESR